MLATIKIFLQKEIHNFSYYYHYDDSLLTETFIKAGFHYWRNQTLVSWVIRALMWKSKIGVVSRVKGYRVGVRRIKTFPFPFDSTYNSVIYEQVKTRLLESKAGVEGYIQPITCTFPCFLIALLLRLLLATLTALFSFDCKQQGHKWNQNAVFTRFLSSNASDYNSLQLHC